MNAKDSEVQDLKKSMLCFVQSSCSDIAAEYGVQFSDEFLSTLREFAYMQTCKFAKDLEVFAKHANRTTIETSDVKLAVRHRKRLYEHICLMDTDEAAKSEKKESDENCSPVIESDFGIEENKAELKSDKIKEVNMNNSAITVNIAHKKAKEKKNMKETRTKNLDIHKTSKIKKNGAKPANKQIDKALVDIKKSTSKKERKKKTMSKSKTNCDNQSNIKTYMASENAKTDITGNKCNNFKSNAGKVKINTSSSQASKKLMNVPLDTLMLLKYKS